MTRLKATLLFVFVVVAIVVVKTWSDSVSAGDCTVTSKGYTPITDLGTGTYTDPDGNTYTGGLYGSGSNTRSASWEAYGQAAASRIYPRDTSGNRDDTNGSIVLASIGMSNGTEEFGGGNGSAGQPATYLVAGFMAATLLPV